MSCRTLCNKCHKTYVPSVKLYHMTERCNENWILSCCFVNNLYNKVCMPQNKKKKNVPKCRRSKSFEVTFNHLNTKSFNCMRQQLSTTDANNKIFQQLLIACESARCVDKLKKNVFRSYITHVAPKEIHKRLYQREVLSCAKWWYLILCQPYVVWCNSILLLNYLYLSFGYMDCRK